MTNAMLKPLERYVLLDVPLEETVPEGIYNERYFYRRDVSTSPMSKYDINPKAVFTRNEFEDMVHRLALRTFVNIAENRAHISVDTRNNKATIKVNIRMKGDQKPFPAEFLMLKTDKVWRVTEWTNFRNYLDIMEKQDMVRTVFE